ncbi:MAG: ABC transporter permease subunit [Propionibacteriaceae bacterium]|jgi:arabinogalactan oligomer/maltooligosaccharide transport system permease protein|nr:ABC transporter permease subunit [Propionibacteriaceae bacterium]
MPQVVIAAEPASGEPSSRLRRDSHSTLWTKGFVAKLVLLAMADALGLYGVIAAWAVRSWPILAVLIPALLAVNIVYFSRRLTPAKYLVPGLVFLLVYQVFVILYTGYAAFTNYGDGHNSTKADAVEAILAQSAIRVEGSPALDLAVLRDGDDYFFLVPDGAGGALIGSDGEALKAAPGARLEAGRPVGLDGYDTLSLGDIIAQTAVITAMAVPCSDDPNDGVLKTPDGAVAYAYIPTLLYDEAAGQLTSQADGAVYADSGEGNFISPDGTVLQPGWKTPIGFRNFTSIITEPSLRGPFLGVLAWTFVYAIGTVVLAFAVGLSLALVLNHPSVKFRRLLRSLLILPYAFPAFLSAMVWQGMLNPQFGFVNQVLLGGRWVDWLGEAWLARATVLVVNVWMAFPYMFLICTGAIQSLPAEVEEAARVDGAGWLRTFWNIKLPLLLVSTAPLLISSFSMNFNNFNSIYLLTGGGPLAQPTDKAGATDILISFVYRLAFGGVNRQYGLACAISMLIFIIVAGISALGFKRTKVLEEMN